MSALNSDIATDNNTLGATPHLIPIPVVVLLPTACISVLLRFWVRKQLLGSVGWDDWTILIALVRDLEKT